jgi:hypothetical protein
MIHAMVPPFPLLFLETNPLNLFGILINENLFRFILEDGKGIAKMKSKRK